MYFHNDYPQKKRTISFEIPAGVDVDLVEFNFEGFAIQKTTTTDPKTFVKTISYELNDIKPHVGEDGSTGTNMNLPHIVPVVKSYTFKGVKTPCFESYNDFYAFLHKLNSEVEKSDDYVKAQADKIIAGKTTDLEKITALYYWVQDNIRYIAFEDGIAGYKPMSAKQVLENKYGDCKGVANLLATMLRLEGFDAKFVWIHTNHTKYTCTLPYLGIFDHAICALYWNNKTYFLDCTESYAAFGENAYRIQNRPVMIEDGETFKIETIPFEDVNSSKYIEKISMKVVGDKLVGESELAARGDLKNFYMRKYHFEKSEKKIDFFKNYFTRSSSNITVSNVKTSDLENREVPFNAKYSFELSNQVFKDDNELFVNMEFDGLFGKNSKDTLRLTDYTFDMIINYDVTVELTIPEGYKVSSLPPAFKIKNDYCSITLEYQVVDGKVLYKKTFIFPSGVIPKDKAAEYAKIQKDLKKYYTNQVTLTK
ncbi:MAG: transglutaminase domain-containing protein [Pseudomonas sp.]